MSSPPPPMPPGQPRRRPRWGIDFHVWDGIYQGSRSHILGLYREAVVRAPDIDFCFFLQGVDSLREQEPAFALPNVQLVRTPHRPAVWRLGVQLPWLRWRHGIDLLHMQYRLPLLRLGPCACTIHDLLFETHPEYFSRAFVWQSRLTFRLAARQADLLFSVSRHSASELARLYGVDAGQVHVTYNGVDRTRFHPGSEGAGLLARLGLTPQGYLLSVGRLEPRKNHLGLLNAYAQLGPDAPPLVIVGQRDFGYSAVFDRLRDSGLQPRVRVLSDVTDAELPAVMRHARLFVYPAFAEGFGMPVAEAMASGVPVITSDTSSLPEVAGEATPQVSPHDPAALARAMRRLLEDEAARQHCVAAGLQHVQRFDWGQSAETLLAAGRELLRRRGRAGESPAPASPQPPAGA